MSAITRKNSQELYAKRWIPIELDGLTLMPTSTGQQAFLVFSAGQVNTVAGSTGCNRLNGKFELSGSNQIKFSPVATTRMMCEPDGNNMETRLLRALEQARNYSFNENRLILLNGKIAVAKFMTQKKTGE